MVIQNTSVSSLENTFYLDIETTGRFSPRDRVVEISIVGPNGQTVINELVNPQVPIGDAKKYHGITDDMVADAKTLEGLYDLIYYVLEGRHVVIFNAKFDTAFFPGRLGFAHVSCAMDRFAGLYGAWNSYHGNHTWQSLSTAMKYYGLEFQGSPHRALADALACRDVWRAMEGLAPGQHGEPESGSPPPALLIDGNSLEPIIDAEEIPF